MVFGSFLYQNQTLVILSFHHHSNFKFEHFSLILPLKNPKVESNKRFQEHFVYKNTLFPYKNAQSTNLEPFSSKTRTFHYQKPKQLSSKVAKKDNKKYT